MLCPSIRKFPRNELHENCFLHEIPWFFFRFRTSLAVLQFGFFLQFDASQIDYNEANHKKDQLNFILAANI